MTEEATPYEVWRWDCPVCGAVNEEGDIEPSGDTECQDCTTTVNVRR